jgi:arylsulfatase A-like enzyme
MCHHKAPHRRWEPDEKHARMYEDEEIPVPETFDDDYATRAKAAKVSKNTMFDLIDDDLKVPVPPGLSREEEKQWRYQRYIKDYLRCIASVDDNIGRLLDYIDQDSELKRNTVIIYTSDQGFFLGDHGWFDKRFMYEESLKMPFIVRYPAMIKENSMCDEIITNVDFAQTFLDLAGLPEPNYMQGRSFVPLLKGETPPDWPETAYHRYWMNQDASHNIYAHYGIRTKRYKLIYYYNRDCGEEGANPGKDEPEWELFDCHKDPLEIDNLYNDPAYGTVVQELTRKLEEEMARIGDTPMH